MLHRTRLRGLAALVVTLVLLSVGASVQADPGVTAVPAPPRIVNCANTLTYYYDQIDVWLWIETGATSAWVYRSTTSSLADATFMGSATEHGSGDAVFVYHDNSAQPFQTYYYWGRSVNSSGQVSGYSTDYAACSLDTLAAPLNVNASDATASSYVSISWSAVTNAYDYKVYRADTSGGEYSYLGRSTTTAYTDSTVERGRLYYYKAQACRQLGNCGSLSNYNGGSARIATPTGVQASQGTRCPEIGVMWNSVPYATSYLVYRVDSLSGNPPVSWTVTTNSHIDTTVGQGITYSYWVQARNALSTSTASTSADGEVGTAPPVPGNVQASNDQADKILVTWLGSAGATTYKVYRATAPFATYYYWALASGTSYEDTTQVTPGETYYYKVSACIGTCCSAQSDYDQGSCPGPAATPITPTITPPTSTPTPKTPTLTPTPGPSPTMTRTPTPTKTVIWPKNHWLRLPLVRK